MKEKPDRKKISDKFVFQNDQLYRKVCGIKDIHIKDLESFLKVEIIPRGNSLLLTGEEERVVYAVQFFMHLEENYKNRPDKEDFDTFDIHYLFRSHESRQQWNPTEKILTNYKGKAIFPKTENQQNFVASLIKNQISIAVGPAGTGKTFLSIAVACRMLQNGEIEKLVLTRPAVEAGESLGFLPGDLTQKVDPYLRPIYDALNECLGYEKVQVLSSLNKIEIAPIAFMRGRTLKNSFIILDEAQNCTVMQLKMILTRLGKGSRMAVSGDITQIDLATGKSGLEKVVNALTEIPEIGIIRLGREDITRHPLVEKIVNRLDNI
ncbi:MAG: PhoH family protein [Leptospiraceae bacterium]|nr:PhoH family protein [Leptospiraceae bacterium]MCP5511661.1 PhoH family protein [Leptospiraceae bacterium]